MSAYKHTATGYIIGIPDIGTFTAMVMRGAFGGPVGRSARIGGGRGRTESAFIFS